MTRCGREYPRPYLRLKIIVEITDELCVKPLRGRVILKITLFVA
jgi:hypothetical protein